MIDGCARWNSYIREAQAIGLIGVGGIVPVQIEVIVRRAPIDRIVVTVIRGGAY
jgi:hypothetical protein